MSVKATFLPDRSVLEIAGEDRQHFLQGLVTNDVESLAQGEGCFAGLLTPQGKILFDFFIVPQGETFLLDCPRALSADLIKRLTLYRLRAKVTIADASDRWRAGAAWGDGAEAWAKANATVAYCDPRTPQRRTPSPQPSPPGRGGLAEAVAPSSPLPEGEGQGEGVRRSPSAEIGLGLRLLFRQPSHAEFRASVADYEAHRIALAIPEGGKDYAYGDAFPHEACFDLLHGVSFTKGCYVGQEVVSRMEHRGTARTRVLAVSATQPLPQGGADISADGFAVGRLGSVAGRRGVALARLDRVKEALAKGRVFMAGDVSVVLAAPAWANYTLGPNPA